MSFVIQSTTNKSPHHNLNEDSHFIGDNLIIVADGMGGESSGDIASKIAVETVSELLKRPLSDVISDNEARELLFSSISQADKAISDYIEKHPASAGMGTTILIAIIRENNMYMAWCGDSHCFLFREGYVMSRTKDHSYVQELIDADRITVEESFTHPDNNLITRYVGGGEGTCVPDYTSCQINVGDIFIFCSDGLSGYCRHEDIRKCISSNINTQNLPVCLMKLAKSHGSDDDITIVTLTDNEQKGKHSSSFWNWLKQNFWGAV